MCGNIWLISSAKTDCLEIRSYVLHIRLYKETFKILSIMPIVDYFIFMLGLRGQGTCYCAAYNQRFSIFEIGSR